MKTPEDKARELIQFYGLSSPEDVNLEELANAERVLIEETDLKGCLGKISFTPRYGLIKIDSKIREPGQKRFTIGHELGHFFLEKDSNVHGCEANDLFSFKADKRREENANRFATELLMYRPWFDTFTEGRKIDFGLIKEAAGYFGVSLSAAAIRYAHAGPTPVAVILSCKGLVVWSCFSTGFPFKWIPGNHRVSKNSAAHAFFAGKMMRSEPELVLARTWFAEDIRCRRDAYLWEQNVEMRYYQSVLTLLWESEY